PLLISADTRQAAIEGGDAPAAYLALWASAFADAASTVGLAAPLLTDSNVGRRFVAAHLLIQLGIVAAQAALLPALGDSDLRVVTRSAQVYERLVDDSLSKSDLFEQLEAALFRFPRSSTPFDPIVWPWMSLTADRATIAGQLLESL